MNSWEESKRNGIPWRRLGKATALGCAVLALTLSGVRTGAARDANTYVFANVVQYDTLDPHQAFDVGRVAARLNLYDGMLRWVDNPPQLIPWLAEKYDVSADGLTYTFTLKKGSKFHDGSEVTAQDVVYSAERILAIKKGASGLLSTMLEPGNVKAVDSHTVQFRLKKPISIFLSIVPEIHIVNSALLKKHEKDGDWGAGWLNSHDAGSGSFVLDRYDPSVGWTAKRNKDHFYGWSATAIDGVQFLSVPEDNTKVLGMLRGDYDGTSGYLPRDLVERLRGSDTVKILDEPSMRIMLFNVNNQRAPLNDVHVRRAINMAFDYNAFINDVLGGTVDRNRGPIPNPMWGRSDAKGYDYDPEAARKELGMSGAKIDRPLDIVFLTGFSQTEQAAVLMQNGLKRIGVEASVRNVNWSVLVDQMKSPDTSPDMVVYWISTYYADPHNWIGEMYNSANWGTFKSSSFYKSDKVDSLLNKAVSITDQGERAKLYAAAEKAIIDDAASVWIYNTRWFGPFNKRVKSIRFSPIGNGQDARWIQFNAN
ncbi:MAG: ABC transporter substrate-binding protein [Hyphomicrobiales bacterium]|nr:ABC transporter substrate-binding protein [Hyphomicrobiales bacterium]